METKILIIIPAFNEEASLLNTYKNILEYNKNNNTHYDVIVINDCSTDNTEKICIENNIPHISLMHNLGIGGAVQTGYKFAKDNGYDIALQYDGDGQHNVAFVRDIIEPIIKGTANIVIGSRFVTDDASEFKSSFSRRVGIRILSHCIKICTGKRLHDVTSGFRAADCNVIREFAVNYPIDYPEPITNTEMIKKGYIVTEVPVSMNERDGGVSSIRAWKNAYYMFNVILSIFVIKLRRYKHVD